MIRLLLVSIIFYSLTAAGQTSFDTSDIRMKYSSIGRLYYFLDSQLIDIDKTYFDYSEVNDVVITKEVLVFYGTLQICRIDLSTNLKNRKLVRLADLHIKKINSQVSQKVSFIIDGKPISDTSNVRVDINFIKSTSQNNSNPENSDSLTTFFIIETKGQPKKNGS